MTYNPTTSPNDAIPLGNRVSIVPSAPQPEFDTLGGRAFRAFYREGENASDLIAILCDKNLPARHESITAARTIDHPSMLRLIENGSVVWPQDNKRYFALAYQRPLTTRMKQSIDEPHTPMNEDFLNHYFIKPMISAMVELQRTGLVHNAIRPTNIFWRIGSTGIPQLGECLSAPAGFGQPALFEPIERALCTPLGRGAGYHADDCYAFGVTLALLILGSNPFQGMDDTSIINMKMERGTFGSFIGNRRMSATHIEILRGLLADDLKQRWTGQELEQWTSGRRLTPKSTDAGKRAARGFEFKGHDYWQARPLAAAMARNVSDAVQIIENGSLDKWLRRAVNDETHASNLVAVVQNLKQSGKTANYEDQLVARACMALDPDGPIHYRGISVMPTGLSSMLVDALMNNQSTQIIAEIISTQLVGVWVEMQPDMSPDLLSLAQQLERMKGLIEKTSFGNGVERIIYELNPGLPCISPIIRSHYVTNGRTLMAALEKVAGTGDKPADPIDRHIAAFLIVRERRSEMSFDAMSSPAGSLKRGLGLLSLYNDLQERYGPEVVPNLAQWLQPALEPLMQRFLGKGVKERLRDQVKQAVMKGSLMMVMRLLDDNRRIERDRQEFMAARMLYLNTLKEIAFLENRLANRDVVVRESGKPMAATISTFIAILMVFAAVLHALWRGLMVGM